MLKSSRASFEAVGVSSAPAEYSGEPACVDKFTDRITLQPSVQSSTDLGGDQGARHVLVPALRARIHLN